MYEWMAHMYKSLTIWSNDFIVWLTQSYLIGGHYKQIEIINNVGHMRSNPIRLLVMDDLDLI
jgi:hypothetical protein